VEAEAPLPRLAAANALLERLAADPALSGLILDVDGTLAPIVADPAAAKVPQATRAVLARLVGRYALVACLSGRPSDAAAEIVGVEGIVYVGEHGLELEPEAQEWAARLREFSASAGWPAEEKRVTASFHYRTAPDPEAARAELEHVAEAARAAGLRPRWGRMVLEVRPPVEADKGTAVRRLLEERSLRRALYAGDDTTDLDAFRALDGLEVAVRVAIASPEAPPELVREADLAFPSPAALVELLQAL
jgi:trehalose 6-phosphate phosphatase